MGLRHDDKRFELVVETGKHGNLLLAIEEIVRALREKASQEEARMSIGIELISTKDGKKYIEGEPWNALVAAWRDAYEQILLLVAAGLIMHVSPTYFPNYHEEAMAVFLGIGIALVLRVFLSFWRRGSSTIDWRLS